MGALARAVIRRRRWVLAAWLILAIAGGMAAPHATKELSYDFGLPGQAGYQANQQIVAQLGSGGDNPPVLIVAGDGTHPVTASDAARLVAAASMSAPGARVASWVDQPALLASGGRTGVVVVYPRPEHGADVYAAALPRMKAAVSASGVPAVVSGEDALATGGGGGGAGVLAETLFGGVGALVVLLVVFGSALALTPLIVAAGSILTTFLLLWGLAAITPVSFIVQFLLALIGLGVAIDYALLVVTRWNEERAQGVSNEAAVERAVTTAGRSVLYSGLTVAISLAALIVLPVPFLRSIGLVGLLIPLISVVGALTLLPAVLVTVGPRLAWPRRRSGNPESRLWRAIGSAVVRRRLPAVIGAGLVLLALASPVLGIRLGEPTAASLASRGGPAGAGLTALTRSGLGVGVVHPVEVLTTDRPAVEAAVRAVPGVAGVISPGSWATAAGAGQRSVIDVWTAADPASSTGSHAAAAIRSAARSTGAVVGGTPAQDADFIHAVYGNAPLVVGLIVVVTFAFLAFALRSVWLPIKALLLNVISIAAAYGVTVAIWQHGIGTHALFGQSSSGAITLWVPVAVFAYLFGLSMDYEVFLLSRIKEEHDAGHETGAATARAVARTGRLITSAALILFLAFVSLSRIPDADVKIMATGLALGIVIDATIVRGVLAPGLVALAGRVNWMWPGRPASDSQ